jgi:hypothetical protein
MAHLTAPSTKRTISEVEIVSDDSMQVIKVYTDGEGAGISIRAATDSSWGATRIATLDKRSAEVIATVLQGGTISEYGSVKELIAGLPTTSHSIEKPVAEKGPMDGDCTPLDIERAKAENLREAKELVQLEMERDHSLDRHATGDVPGCPACDRKVIPSVMPDGEDLPF